MTDQKHSITVPVLVDRGDLTEQPKDANGRLLLNAYGRAAWAAGHDTATKEYAIELRNARETAERLREDYLQKCEALAKPKANVAMVAQELRGLAHCRRMVYRMTDITAAFVDRLANVLDPDGRSRDPQSPHVLPVSTVQALIDQALDDHARIERQLRAEIDTLRGVRDDLKARLKAALLASPSFSDAQRVQELERKLHHEGIEHSEAQERIIKLEAHAVELEREVARLKAHYEPEMCVLCPTCQPAGSKVPTSVCPTCAGAATIPKSRLT